MDVFPVILPSHLQIGDQNGQKKIDLFWLYPIEWVYDESNFKLGQKIGKIATNLGQIGNQNSKKNRPFLGVSNRMGLR